MNDAAGIGREFSTAVVMFHEAVAQRLGLAATDHKALGVIVREGPLPASQLARRLAMKPSAVTGLVDRLVEAGYVSRTSDPGDRRRVIIAADGGDRPELYGIFQHLSEDIGKIMADYTPEQLDAVLDYLTRVTDVLRDHAEDLNRL